MTFNSNLNQIEVKTFSPYLNAYKTGENSNFNLSYTLNTLPDGSMAPIQAPFTIIVLPDTQYYSSSHPEIFLNQTQWILANKQQLNIVFVIHLGDIVDNFGSMTQWSNAYEAMNVLRQNLIPFSLCVGNHDFYTLFETHLTSSYYGFTQTISYSAQTTFKGSLNNDNFNSYNIFTVGSLQFLVLSLEWAPTSADLSWANQIISQNPNAKVIVTTHEYLGAGGRTTVGENIWQNLVKTNAVQAQIVLCGHNNGEGIDFNSLLGIQVSNEMLRVDYG
jgi:hypothetical protein